MSSDNKMPKYKDELTEAYEFIENGVFPERVQFHEEELELTPYEMPYRLDNWPIDDLIMFVGGDRSLYL